METDVAASLLAYLRSALGADDISYVEPPVRVTGGFDTHIYGFRIQGALEEWSGPLIVRLFRSENPWVTLTLPSRARFETTVQNTVRIMGYPAPRVLQTCVEADHLGAPFLIMERLSGRIMLDLLLRPSLFWLRLPDALAEAQARLHGLEPHILKQAVEADGIPQAVLTVGDWLDRVARLINETQLEGLAPGLTWLRENDPTDPQPSVICHGDFHPLNILMEKGRVTGVIDWPWVRIAPPEYDVGATIALLTQGPVGLPVFLRGAGNLIRRRIAGRYLRAYERARPLDARVLGYYEAVRLLGFLFEAGEHRQGDLGVVPRPDKPTAFGAQIVINGIVSRFREITGITPALPPATHRT